MVDHIIKSAGNAFRGMAHALQTEKNLKLFLGGYVVVLVFASRLPLTQGEWIALLLAGGLFLATELLNTSIERLADTVDDHCKSAHGSHCYVALRETKDTAAAASLVSLGVVVVVVLIIFLPRLPF